MENIMQKTKRQSLERLNSMKKKFGRILTDLFDDRIRSSVVWSLSCFSNSSRASDSSFISYLFTSFTP